MPLFEGAHIHGVTLSLLLHSAAVSQQDCDGLLFGQIKKKVRSEFRDDDVGVVQVEEVHVYVTSFICSTTTGTFYDVAGNVSAAQLTALQGADRDPIIGWCMARPSCGAPAHPSMRESAVTASLQQLLASQRPSGTAGHPVLLAILGQRADHHGATITMTYRLFQHLAPSSPGNQPLVVPIELHTLSLARQQGATPAAQLAGDALMTDRACGVCGVAHPASQQQQHQQQAVRASGGFAESSAANMVLSSTAAASVQHVMQLEEFHQNQLRTLQGVCRLVSEQSSMLRALQLEGDQLARQLADMDQPLTV